MGSAFAEAPHLNLRRHKFNTAEIADYAVGRIGIEHAAHHARSACEIAAREGDRSVHIPDAAGLIRTVPAPVQSRVFAFRSPIERFRSLRRRRRKRPRAQPLDPHLWQHDPLHVELVGKADTECRFCDFLSHASDSEENYSLFRHCRVSRKII